MSLQIIENLSHVEKCPTHWENTFSISSLLCQSMPFDNLTVQAENNLLVLREVPLSSRRVYTLPPVNPAGDFSLFHSEPCRRFWTLPTVNPTGDFTRALSHQCTCHRFYNLSKWTLTETLHSPPVNPAGDFSLSPSEPWRRFYTLPQWTLPEILHSPTVDPAGDFTLSHSEPFRIFYTLPQWTLPEILHSTTVNPAWVFTLYHSEPCRLLSSLCELPAGRKAFEQVDGLYDGVADPAAALAGGRGQGRAGGARGRGCSSALQQPQVLDKNYLL